MPKRTALDSKADLVVAFLAARGVVAEQPQIVEMLRERRDQIADRLGIQPRSATAHLTDEVLLALAERLIEMVSEEIPPGGGVPWDGHPAVELPVPFAARIATALGVVAGARIGTGQTDLAVFSLQSQTSICLLLAAGTGGPTVLAPREGLLYAARMLAAAAVELEAGTLLLDPADPVSPADLARSVQGDVARLRVLIERAA